MPMIFCDHDGIREEMPALDAAVSSTFAQFKFFD
jgi:hypothetical protein